METQLSNRPWVVVSLFYGLFSFCAILFFSLYIFSIGSGMFMPPLSGDAGVGAALALWFYSIASFVCGVVQLIIYVFIKRYQNNLNNILAKVVFGCVVFIVLSMGYFILQIREFRCSLGLPIHPPAVPCFNFE